MPQTYCPTRIIEFTTYKSSNDYSGQLRRIEYYAVEQGRDLALITNAMDFTELESTLLHKSNWSMELFFKWVKHHLKTKKFLGGSENTVRIQIYTAIISSGLVAIVHHKMRLKTPVYNAHQILGISLIDLTLLEDLFNRFNLDIDKELDGLYEPTLIDY